MLVITTSQPHVQPCKKRLRDELSARFDFLFAQRSFEFDASSSRTEQSEDSAFPSGNQIKATITFSPLCLHAGEFLNRRKNSVLDGPCWRRQQCLELCVGGGEVAMFWCSSLCWPDGDFSVDSDNLVSSCSR